MKLPVSWLRDYVAFDVPLPELAETLVLSGLEVDRIVQRGAPDLDGNHGHFKIGRVVEFGKHPNADRLRLCRVDVGEGEPRQIVCGASNFVTGDTVVVALPGAVLPGAAEPLRRAKLRGEVSDGMMLSERELQLSDEHDGIIRLPDIYEIGSDAAEHFALAETVLDIEVTANRGDLMCVYGIAREISTLLDVELAPMPGVAPAATVQRPTSDVIRVAIDAPDRCLRFTARAFEGVTIAASPLLVRQRIAACGMRPISNAVDITNYVMLGIGSPTHAYDATTIAGGELTARLARPGEAITTLDGKPRTLTGDMLVIADASSAHGIAGVMGAAHSEISPDTTTVVLEAANFERHGIARAAAALGLRTDSASRWIRGVDPHLAPRASAWAAQLLVELAGGQMLADDQDVHGPLPERERIVLRTGFAERVLGMPISDDEAMRILGRLGYEPERVAEGVAGTVPTWRLQDTTREIDLVEEVGRIHGLDELPATIPGRTDGGGRLNRSQWVRRRVEDALAGAGLQEAYTLSLVDAGLSDLYGLAPDDERRGMVALQNPLSADYALMRRTLIPSLLRAVRRNRSIGRPDVGLFEIAHLYHAPGGRVSADRLADEPWTLGLVLSGRLGGASWSSTGLEADFFTVKGVLETVCARLGVPIRLEAVRQPYLHPGRAARILLGGGATPAGELGELHPATAERFELDGRVAILELDLDALTAVAPERFTYAPVPEQPPVLQDIAVVVRDDVPSQELVEAALAAGAPLLTEAEVFDVYRDEQRLGAGRVSLAIRLVFQDPARTLTEDEASAVREQVVAVLAERFGAELRR
jgi:phenylalanyl-tRNA synthetase beta chain